MHIAQLKRPLLVLALHLSHDLLIEYCDACSALKPNEFLGIALIANPWLTPSSQKFPHHNLIGRSEARAQPQARQWVDPRLTPVKKQPLTSFPHSILLILLFKR